MFLGSDMDRKNLEYRVLKKSNRIEHNIRFISRYLLDVTSGLVYCATRNECDKVAELLTIHLGKPVRSYHSGLNASERKRNAFEWKLGLSPVLVATSAFELGVNHSSVRVVIHFSPPLSLSSYIQQCGRAGRDGKPAQCILLYDELSFKLSRAMVKQSSLATKQDLDEMIAFCLSEDCIRARLVQKMTGTLPENLNCNINTCSCRN